MRALRPAGVRAVLLDRCPATRAIVSVPSDDATDALKSAGGRGGHGPWHDAGAWVLRDSGNARSGRPARVTARRSCVTRSIGRRRSAFDVARGTTSVQGDGRIRALVARRVGACVADEGLEDVRRRVRVHSRGFGDHVRRVDVALPQRGRLRGWWQVRTHFPRSADRVVWCRRLHGASRSGSTSGVIEDGGRSSRAPPSSHAAWRAR